MRTRTNDEIREIIFIANQLIVGVTPEEIDNLARHYDRQHADGEQVIKSTRLLNAFLPYRNKLMAIETEPVETEGQKLEERRAYNRRKKAESKENAG